MGIMDMFNGVFGSGQQPQQQQVNVAPTPGSIPANTDANGKTTPQTAPNGVVPQSANTSGDKPAAPFADFADLWKNDPTTESKSDQGLFSNVDPAKLMEAAKKIDFSKSVTPEIMQRVAAGGEDGMRAMLEAMNASAQSVYAQSAFATTKIVEQALSKAQESYDAKIPSMIKKHQVSDNLRQENPIFSNPAVQPIISALEAQMTVKFPNASATEITNMAKQYVEQLGTSFAPKPADTAKNKSKKEEMDWSSFLQ